MTTPHLRIQVSYSYQDADELGSFPADMRPVCVRIHVQGYPDKYPDRRQRAPIWSTSTRPSNRKRGRVRCSADSGRIMRTK